MLVYVEELFSVHKATYNLKGKIINLKELFEQNKQTFELELNTESPNQRLWVKYKKLKFWMSYTGKLTIYCLKTDDREYIKQILESFYFEAIPKYLVNDNRI